eukprot:scaffold57042_cov52-Attheya_sp.AAC.3
MLCSLLCLLIGGCADDVTCRRHDVVAKNAKRENNSLPGYVRAYMNPDIWDYSCRASRLLYSMI